MGFLQCAVASQEKERPAKKRPYKGHPFPNATGGNPPRENWGAGGGLTGPTVQHGNSHKARPRAGAKYVPPAKQGDIQIWACPSLTHSRSQGGSTPCGYYNKERYDRCARRGLPKGCDGQRRDAQLEVKNFAEYLEHNKKYGQ